MTEKQQFTSKPAELDEYGKARADFWVSPPRGTCPTCGDEDVILHEKPDTAGVCATCYRTSALATRDHDYPCDHPDCSERAFRDPLGRKNVYLCRKHHEEQGYIPGERAMVTKVAARVGWTHSQGRKAVCIAANRGTDCKGQIKPRGKLGVLCDAHNNPKLFK